MDIVERTQFEVGESASLTRRITTEDIQAFARISGDENPVHLDEKYARDTYFQGCIAHGMLVAGLISAVLGNKLPGPGSIYLGQEIRFKAPVRPGDTVTARVEITSWDPEKGRVNLQTEVTNQEDVTVITGSAQLVMSSYLKRS